MSRHPAQNSFRIFLAAFLLTGAASGWAGILWSDLGATLVHESGKGTDILGGVVKRDNSSSDTLYFKFHVDPHSDVSTEEYFAAFELYEGEMEHLGLGNSLQAWAYSAFNTSGSGEFNKVFGDIDLHSARPESSAPGIFLPYELPRRGIENTLVFRVQYVPGGLDVVTVWLNPDLAPGATEASQPESLTTTFTADASFDQIRLRHSGGGGGWIFSDMAIGTSFSDFVSFGSADFGAAPGEAGRGVLPLTFRSWQREQGLPQNSVRALAQTRDGYLWIGSDDGVARFDGIRFVSFGLREGLRSGRVRTLFEDSLGTLWIGTVSGGLARRQADKFSTFTMQDGLPADSITALGEDNEGRLWVGTEAGLVIWQKDKFGPLNGAEQLKGRTITTISRDAKGTLWLGAAGVGIFYYQAGKLVPIADTSAEGLLRDPHCVLVDKSGRIWVGAGDDFVLCREDNQWRRYRIPRHLARPYVSALTEQPDGTIWAGSVSEGLFQFKQGKLAAINASSGLSDNFIESLLVDHEGNLWIGTASGLNRLRRSNLSIFGQAEGLGYGAVQGMAEISPGLIWAGKPSDGLYEWQGNAFRRLNAAGLARGYPQVNSLVVTREGACWVSSAHGLLCFKDPKNMEAASGESALPGLNVLAIAQDREGSIWAGTQEGELWRLLNGKWMTNFSQTHPITAILPDPDGSMWIGSEGGGLEHIENGVRKPLDKHSGLLSDFIRTLYLDQRGTLWIGTTGGGLTRRQAGGRIATFTTREGLADNIISQILEDDVGRLWLGSNRGVSCVSKHDLEELAAGRLTMVYPQVYGRAEGMPSEECTGGFYPAGLKTKSGLLWFSTLKGIVTVDPRLQLTDARPPMVVLEEVLVDGTDVLPLKSNSSLSPELNISPGKHRFEFHYTGLSFSAPERVRFRYRLESLDPEWVEAGPRRIAFYGFVPSGVYHFRVTACSQDGVWNQIEASLTFKVLPRFWQTWWFITLAALGLLSSVGGAVRGLERRKHQTRLLHLEQERALERERARIAQDLHDDLGSSLTRISLLSDLAMADKEQPGQVEIHAAKISQSAAQSVRALEEIVWALRPGSDSVQSLVEYIAHFANELFDGDNARCRLDLPHDLAALPLPPEMRHNIFLIVKEALTNALKHAAAREVRVQAKTSANSLEIMVQDNGRGFQQNERSARESQHGLGNMQRRADAMGGVLAIESDPGKGTTIRLKVSFSR